MLKILISSLRDGSNDISLDCLVEEIDNIFGEFFGTVSFKGVVKKVRDKYAIKGTASCSAKVLCDLSNEEYIEFVETEMELSFIQNSLMANEIELSGADTALGEHYLHDDVMYLDLTSEVGEALSVALPLKRIAPKYKDKDIREIYPDLDLNKEETVDDDSVDPANSPWAVLKKLNLN